MTYLSSSPMRDADITRFTCGDCHILASRIHRLTGWPMATFYDKTWGHPTDHAFVICPDGDALDVEGKMPLDQFAAKWSWTTADIKTWTGRQLWKTSWAAGPSFGHYSYARARQIAGIVLANIGWKA